MRVRLQRFCLTKAVPLAISRGTTAKVEHLLVEIEQDGLIGRGETGGFDTGQRAYETDAIAAELAALVPQLEPLAPEPLQALEPLLAVLSPPARCGLELALHDWWGQRLGQPLHRLWGLDPGACVATSVTLGLGEPAAVLARLERWWQQLPASRIKLKLGSPAGADHDRALVQAVSGALARRRDLGHGPLELQVDANGGWDLATAQAMVPWLAEQGVVLVEQPLAALADPSADRAGFAALHGLAPVALVADESCWNLADLLRLAPVVDGINIKLLKSGGLAEALLLARCARRLGLDVMLGCYSDSSLLNSAAAQLLPLVEWPDLDSHLNLVDDPFLGAELSGDYLRPSQLPGLGVRWAPRRGAKPEPQGAWSPQAATPATAAEARRPDAQRLCPPSASAPWRPRQPLRQNRPGPVALSPRPDRGRGRSRPCRRRPRGAHRHPPRRADRGLPG